MTRQIPKVSGSDSTLQVLSHRMRRLLNTAAVLVVLLVLASALAAILAAARDTAGVHAVRALVYLAAGCLLLDFAALIVLSSMAVLKLIDRQTIDDTCGPDLNVNADSVNTEKTGDLL